MPSVSIIGVGRVGGALAIALSEAGFEIESLIHRDPSIADRVSKLLPNGVRLISWSDSLQKITSDILLIATPDPDITSISKALLGRLNPDTVIAHTSGSLSSEALAPLAANGHSVASMHPLTSISDAVAGSRNFQNAYFCIEGNEPALETIRALTESIGGRPFSIDSADKPLYHAAAVMACGHLVALIDMAVEMLSKCGVDAVRAQEILLPLIASTVENLRTQKPSEALTGSFARLDTAAVERHLSAMDGRIDPSIRDVYIRLGERSIDLASESDGSGRVDDMREVISIAKRKSG